MSVPSVSIENRNGVVMLIDQEDLGLLRRHKNGHWCFTVTPKGYARLRDKKHGGLGQVVYFHRLVMNLPTGLQVHHINGNKLDNRRENLQLCVCSQKIINTAVSEVSRFRGVSKNGKKWRAGQNRDLRVTRRPVLVTAWWDRVPRTEGSSCRHRPRTRSPTCWPG